MAHVAAVSCPMSDPQIIAALEYMNQQRTQQAIELALATPPPAALSSTAEIIAARAWVTEAQRPPLTPTEVQAAVSILEQAAGVQRQQTLTKRVPIEGGAGGSSGRGGTGTSSGGAGRPGGETGPAFGAAATDGSVPDPIDSFLRWLLEPGQYPEPQVRLHPKEKLAAVNAALRRMNLPARRQHLLELQAWYYYQARALQAQGL